jgi:leukotriene-A4 hydrolase
VADAPLALAAKWKSDEVSMASYLVNNMLKHQNFTPSPDDIKDMTATHLVVLLDSILKSEKPLSAEKSRLLGKVYDLGATQNMELLSRYTEIGLYAKDEGMLEPAVELLGNVGGMRYLRRVYKALYSANKALAEKTLQKHMDFYHPICRQLLREDFEKLRAKTVEWREDDDMVIVSQKEMA